MTKLSAVRKVLETTMFQVLGSFETLGSKLSHGTSWIAEIIQWIISPNVRTHLRKVFNMTFSQTLNCFLIVEQDAVVEWTLLR